MKTAIVGLLLLSGCYGGLSDPVDTDTDAGTVDVDAGRTHCCMLPRDVYACGSRCDTDAGEVTNQ